MIVRLVPNTGIQFVELVDLERDALQRAATTFDVREVADERSGLHELREADRSRDQYDFYGDAEPDQGGFVQRSARVDALLDLAAASDGLWFPLPFDRGGPWVCMYLVQGKEGSFRAALAVDTTVEESGNPEGVSGEEIGDCQVQPASRRFWRRPSVASFVRTIIQRASDIPNITLPSTSGLQLAIAAMAAYLRRSFDNGSGLCINLAAVPERGQTVKVDLVLDLGNSRTCALLVEETPAFRQERLELIYPSDPFTSHQCPFDTQFAFVEHEVALLHEELADHGQGFRFISQIVMGPPAGMLLRRMIFDPQAVGMTSPKRYLWETHEPVRWEWRLADRRDPQTGQPPVIRGNVLRHMNPARPLQTPGAPELPASPNYPRQACAVWCITELLEQAFRHVNSARWRKAATRAPMCDLRREIANLVIIYPAGMHSEEIRSYKAACETACRLWASFRTDPNAFSLGEQVARDDLHGILPPNVQISCDEGLAIQICWLYGEAVHRHKGELKSMIQHLGRRRGPAGSEEDTLRLASLDIGGGTIDLAIADYSFDPKKPTSVGARCRRLFHDGISRAGDEVVRSLLEREIFRSIIDQCGVDLARWNGDYLKGEDETSVALRRLLVRNVWMPIALECLARMEATESFEAALSTFPGVDGAKLNELENVLFAGEAPKVRLRDVVIRLDRDRMNSLIRPAIGRTISQCCDIIDQYQCDLLVVGGRPSSNPSIRRQILHAMAVPPGQVVFLSEMRVGDWYPFTTYRQRIGDAKTCGVVGAALAFRALYGYGNFRLQVEPTEEPQAIIGHLLSDARALAANSALGFADCNALRDLERGHELTITPMVGSDEGLIIALRRINHPSAEAKPIYLVRMKSQYKRLLQRNPVHQGDVAIELAYGRAPAVDRRVELGDGILLPAGVIRDIVQLKSVRGDIMLPNGRSVPGDAAIECVLKTMIDGEGYWIDTGRFKEFETEGRE
jgi:hypothetical protein